MRNDLKPGNPALPLPCSHTEQDIMTAGRISIKVQLPAWCIELCQLAMPAIVTGMSLTPDMTRKHTDDQFGMEVNCEKDLVTLARKQTHSRLHRRAWK